MINAKLNFFNKNVDNLTNKINEVHSVNKYLINSNRRSPYNLSPANRVQITKNLTDIGETHNEQGIGSITLTEKKGKEPIKNGQKIISFNPYLVPLNNSDQIKFSSLKSNTLSRTSSKTTVLPSITKSPALKKNKISTLLNKSFKIESNKLPVIKLKKTKSPSFTKKICEETEHELIRIESSKTRDLESELAKRICSSKTSVRSNNDKNLNLRFGSLLSEDGNYAMLKTYEDMIYSDLLTLYPQLAATVSLLRTDTNDFKNFPIKFNSTQSQKNFPYINVELKSKKKLIELENIEIINHKNNISKQLDMAMKIYDAIQLKKGTLTTLPNNINFTNEKKIVKAFVNWKNDWHTIKK